MDIIDDAEPVRNVLPDAFFAAWNVFCYALIVLTEPRKAFAKGMLDDILGRGKGRAG